MFLTFSLTNSKHSALMIYCPQEGPAIFILSMSEDFRVQRDSELVFPGPGVGDKRTGTGGNDLFLLHKSNPVEDQTAKR
jgi:hypothetical protein